VAFSALFQANLVNKSPEMVTETSGNHNDGRASQIVWLMHVAMAEAGVSVVWRVEEKDYQVCAPKPKARASGRGSHEHLHSLA